jgi:hypothetical protein
MEREGEHGVTPRREKTTVSALRGARCPRAKQERLIQLLRRRKLIKHRCRSLRLANALAFSGSNSAKSFSAILRGTKNEIASFRFQFVCECVCEAIRATRRRPQVIDSNGEPSRARTCDPLIKSQLLYQLSYRPTAEVKIIRLLTSESSGRLGKTHIRASPIAGRLSNVLIERRIRVPALVGSFLALQKPD